MSAEHLTYSLVALELRAAALAKALAMGHLGDDQLAEESNGTLFRIDEHLEKAMVTNVCGLAALVEEECRNFRRWQNKVRRGTVRFA